MSSMNPQTIQAYDDHVSDYIANTPAELSDDFKPWLEDSLSHFTKGANILELGSANGRDAAYMESRGFTVERTDASQSFVAFLRSHGHSAKVLNALTDDLGDGYDMVFANAVLLHFTRSEAAEVVHKVYTSPKPGGRFLFSLKQGDGDEIESSKLGAARYFCYWQMPGAEQLAENAGFKIIWKKANEDYRPGRPGWLLLTAEKSAKL